ncbi:NAD-dependent epimerase/dehydratase family protein [Sphaerisporangium sp. NPDC005289]|uniref:NAD-dependent epimerase/dehydratase family protein n=1 Tax=Sphaerisporangium sp. NPDC005289 TaxID=3155247 RepID=UPI0033A464D9
MTGSAGSIGSHVVEALEEAGTDVGAPTYETATTCAGTVLDRVLPGVEAVVHQAAKVGLGVNVADLSGYTSVNAYGKDRTHSAGSAPSNGWPLTKHNANACT